jgi:glutamine synthetase
LLPTDWLTSIQALEQSTWASEALGQEFLKVYLAIKRAEYRVSRAEVGELDWRRSLTQA